MFEAIRKLFGSARPLAPVVAHVQISAIMNGAQYDDITHISVKAGKTIELFCKPLDKNGLPVAIQTEWPGRLTEHMVYLFPDEKLPFTFKEPGIHIITARAQGIEQQLELTVT